MRGYTLPAGKVQISFSGGRTSAYMLHQLLAVNGDFDPDRVQVVFANTGREMPQTYAFLQRCSEEWGVPITWVEGRPYNESGNRFEVVSHNSASRNGEPFKQLIERKKYLPNQQARFCTSELKVRPAIDYLRSIGWDYWKAAIGIRADEPRRIKREPQKERWQRWYPLADCQIDKDIVMKFWARQSFDLQVPQGLGNCDGCMLKSEATLAALARDYPERHAWWQDMEALASSLTASPNGARFRKEFTRAELADYVDRQGDWIFDQEDALCQADHGECTG